MDALEVDVAVAGADADAGALDVDPDVVPAAVLAHATGVVAEHVLLAQLLEDATEDGLDVGDLVDALDVAAALDHRLSSVWYSTSFSLALRKAEA